MKVRYGRVLMVIAFILICLFASNYYTKNKVKTLKEYYKGGKLKLTTDTKKGKKHGLTTFFYENGNIEQKTIWIDGKKNGLHENYYINGELKSKEIYNEGKLISNVEIFYETGELLEVQNYYDDGKLKNYERYSKEGEIIKKGSQPKFEFKDEEKYKLVIDFSNSIYDSTDVIIGNLDSKGQEVVDTLAFLKSPSNVYEYIVKRDSVGTFDITGVARDLKYDSIGLLKLNIIPFRMSYHVEGTN